MSSGEHQNTAGETSEDVPLIQNISQNPQLRQRYCNTRKCVNSKAALLILHLNLIVSIMYYFLFKPNIPQLFNFKYSIAVAGYSAAVFCFYPLAGYLADNKFGRYKTVLTSLRMLLLALTLASVGAGVLVISFVIFRSCDALVGIGALITSVGLILMVVGFIGFNANMIQFGLDQLHDSPGEDQTIFIHWSLWTYYLAQSIVSLVLNISQISDSVLAYSLLGSTYFLVILLFIVTLYVAHRRRSWFLIDPGRLNPYKLVYQVSKFAHQHKVPVNRSAFTYCEDEVPSGLDLAKNKYGGPFTTEQVEDVKAFYEILKVLFCFGLVSFLNVAADPMHSYLESIDTNSDNEAYSSNVTASVTNKEIAENIFLDNDMLCSLFIVVCIPLYLLILRPFMSDYIPGMLKRMEIGILLVVLSSIVAFIAETMIHADNKRLGCMFKEGESFNGSTVLPSLTDKYTTFSAYTSLTIIIQSAILALSNMLIYVALNEVICSQSPHSMKGLLIGLSFAIKGVFKILSSVIVTLLALVWHANSFPSCGMYYYLINTGVGVLAVLVFAYVIRRYKYRKRDEPCHVRRYVEDYYSNIQ